MSDVTFGLSPERMKQLLECKAEVGFAHQKHTPKAFVYTPKPKAEGLRVKERSASAIAQAKWRAKNPDLHRRRVREAMRRLRARRKLEASR